MNHIRDKLPDMKARLNTLMGQAQQELNSFGDAAIFGDKNQVEQYGGIYSNVRTDGPTARCSGSSAHESIRPRLHLIYRRHQG